MRVRAAHDLTALILALTLLGLPGCVHRVERKEWLPGEAASLDRSSRFLKAHARDGSAFVFSQWSVDTVGRTVSGQGRVLGINREPLREGPISVALDSVALFETNVVSKHPSVTALAVITGISALITAVCISDPKACFGSCPTFYVWDGERWSLQAEGFSASVSPVLEKTDLDALYRARPKGRDLELRMRNEALETQVVRTADVLAVRRPAGGRVFADAAGRFWEAEEPVAPRSASADEGDCGATLEAFDGVERFSATDSFDLAARETIDLEFPARAPGDYGLVVAMRQTLLSTYIFYQALAYLGREAGSWLAALERSDAKTRARMFGAGRALGTIEVQVADEGGWRAAGEIVETGPLATDVRLLRLPSSPASPARVRLRLTRGAWRLDWVALVRLGHAVEPIRLRPERVMHGGSVADEAREQLRDPARALVTIPGDEYTLIYRLPENPRGCELFLESRGYYLEWMRDEWVAEENPSRAAMMFVDPARALRVMAPEFKRREAAMEASFWGSRYARR